MASSIYGVSFAAWEVCPKLILERVDLPRPLNYQYFREDPKAEIERRDTLDAEFFNHELQKVNTGNIGSMQRFCEKFGFPFSVFYNSQERFVACRNSSSRNPYTKQFGIDLHGANGLYAIDNECQSWTREYLESKGIQIDIGGQDYYGTFLQGSEYARQLNWEKPRKAKRGGIIGVDEVALSLRLLQNALLLLVSSACYNTAPEAIEYLFNSSAKQMHQSDKSMVEPGSHAPLLLTDRMGAPLRIYTPNSPERASTTMDPFTIDQQCNSAFQYAVERAKKFTDSLPRTQAGTNYGSSLIATIMLQFDRTMTSPIPWRKCDCCGRMFKQQHEYREGSQRFRQASYCKQACRIKGKTE